MNDLELAKKILKEGEYSLVFVKNGEVIYRSSDRGIKALYTMVKGDYGKYRDSYVADRVVGKGAALVYDIIGIKSLYADLMSEAAMDYLDSKSIAYSYDLKTPAIKNRDETDLCPIEKLSMDSLGGVGFIHLLDSFFDKI